MRPSTILGARLRRQVGQRRSAFGKRGDQHVLRRCRRQKCVDLGLCTLHDKTRRNQQFGSGGAGARDRFVDPQRPLIEPRQVGRDVGGARQRLGLRHELDECHVRSAHLVEAKGMFLELRIGACVVERPLHDGGRCALGVAEQAGVPHLELGQAGSALRLRQRGQMTIERILLRTGEILGDGGQLRIDAYRVGGTLVCPGGEGRIEPVGRHGRRHNAGVGRTRVAMKTISRS